jgi:hypothetical protein
MIIVSLIKYYEKKCGRPRHGTHDNVIWRMRFVWLLDMAGDLYSDYVQCFVYLDNLTT